MALNLVVIVDAPAVLVQRLLPPLGQWGRWLVAGLVGDRVEVVRLLLAKGAVLLLDQLPVLGQWGSLLAASATE